MRSPRPLRAASITFFCVLAYTTQPPRAHAQPPEAPPTEPSPAALEPPAEIAQPEAVPPPPLVSAPAAATPAASTDPCQDCMHQRRSADYMIGFLMGAGVFDLSELNDRLADNGYERLDGPVVVIGGEGRAIGESGFVFGAHGAAMLGISGDGPGALETEWSGGYAMADLGFAPIRLESFLLAVTAGIGGYGVALEIADNRDAGFDDVLESPRRMTTLSRAGVIFGLTLRMDARIPVGSVRFKHRSYIALGIRVSGLFGPAIGHWSLPDEDDAKGGPSTGLTGAYAALVLGWGGRAIEN